MKIISQVPFLATLIVVSTAIFVPATPFTMSAPVSSSAVASSFASTGAAYPQNLFLPTATQPGLSSASSYTSASGFVPKYTVGFTQAVTPLIAATSSASTNSVASAATPEHYFGLVQALSPKPSTLSSSFASATVPGNNIGLASSQQTHLLQPLDLNKVR